MYLNTAPAEPARLPCIRDYAELLHMHLPPAPVIKCTPLPELARRLHEIVAEHPHLREEAPLVLSGETDRRQRLTGLRLAVAPGRPQVA